MSCEIIEKYDDLKPFHYLLSLSFSQFKALTERSGREYNDKDRKASFTDMNKFCKSVIKSKGNIKRLYTYSLNTPAGLGGRLFCGGSIQGVPREIRGLVMKHTTDIDMKNAHPTILSYICHKHNIPCPYLDYYVNNRDEILSKFPDRNIGKNAILKQLNKNEVIRNMGIDELGNEIIVIQRKITALDDYIGYEETVAAKKWNKEGSYLNKIMCLYEDRILDAAKRAIHTYDADIQIRGLMFDGIMPDGDFYDDADILTHITESVNTEFKGLNMKWDYKEHDDSIVIPDDFEIPTEIKKEDDSIVATDNNDACMLLLPVLKQILIYCNGQWFLKVGNIWINDKEYIDNYVLDFIATSKIYKKTKDDITTYAQDVSVAEKIRKLLYAKLITQKDKVNIYQKFHTTTLNRLCFLDGVLDFNTKKFYSWEEVNGKVMVEMVNGKEAEKKIEPAFEYYSCVQINRNYADYFKNPDKDTITKVKTQIFDNLFGKDVTKALNLLSRGITGNIEDKNFGILLGSRDNGKGCFYELVKNAFEKYVGSFVLDNVMYQRNTPKTNNGSRDLYWLIDYEFTRLAIAQETPDTEKNMKVNGSLWKKMCSGGDEQTARRCYDRFDTKFTIDTTFLVMGNNELIFDDDDVKEHQVDFVNIKQFKTQAEIDDMISEGLPQSVYGIYGVKDKTIKTSCRSVEWGNAVIYLLFENYINDAVPVYYQKDTGDDVLKPLRMRIADAYEFTDSVKNCILVSEVEMQFYKDNKKMVLNNVVSMGGVKKKENDRNSVNYGKWVYCCIKEKTDSATDNTSEGHTTGEDDD